MYVTLRHKVNKIEGAQTNFDMDFQFWTRAQGSKGKNPIMNYEQLLSFTFSCFYGQKK